MKSAPVTVVLGIRASSGADAELVTCQVHGSDTCLPLTARHPSDPDRCHVAGLRSDRHPRSHASLLSDVIEPRLTDAYDDGGLFGFHFE